MHLVINMRLRGGGGFKINATATDYITGAVVELYLGEDGDWEYLDAAAKKITAKINLSIKPELLKIISV